MDGIYMSVLTDMEPYLEKELFSAFNGIKPVLKDDKAYLKMKPIEESRKAIELLGSLYVRYLKVVNDLIEVHNYLLNPMKRKCLKSVIEKIFGRILEIKHEMVDVEKSDFQYLDNIILQNYITRRNVQLKIPLYFRDKRENVLLSMYNQIDKVIYKKEHPEVIGKDDESEEDTGYRETLKSVTRTSVRSGHGSVLSPRGSRRGTIESRRASFARDSVHAERRPQGPDVEEKVFEFLYEIKLIQRHERARAGRLKTFQTKERDRVAYEKAWQIYEPIPEALMEKATETIQNYYMAYKNRRWKKYLNIYKGLTYGTLVPSYRDRTDINVVQAQIEERKKQQKVLEMEIEEKRVILMEKMQTMRKYEIMDDMITELRAFIRGWYDFTKEYGYTEVPEWPPDDEIIPPARVMGIPEGLPKYYINANFPEMDYTKVGPAPTTTLAGSELITAGYWIRVEQYAVAAELARRILAKGLSKEDEERNAREKELEKEREEQKKEEEQLKMEELMRRGHVPFPSNFSKDLASLIGEFVQDWDVGKPYAMEKEQANMEARLLTEANYSIIKQVRKEVDDQMRKELKILKAAIDKDNPENKVVLSKTKKKKPKEKKKKKGKKGKKDPLANRTLESLFDDLTEEELIIKCIPTDIDSLPGQYNFHAQEARARGDNPIPYMGDVYQVAKEYIVLPLACQTVKENTPSVKSVLLIGPDRLTHPLVHGLVYSIGALLINLPALNFTKTFKPKILISMILKVAKEYEPSIILIDGAEKPYYKKVPKPEKSMRPGALKAIIPKLIKGIKAADRIVVLGTAEKPWMSKPKLASVFQKILICPENDFNTVSTLVQQIIMSYHGVDREFDTSVPAAMYMGCDLFEMEEKLKSIFTIPRRIRLYYDPLKVEETGCIDKEFPKATSLEDWYNKMYPLNKERKKIADIEKERLEREAKLKENAEKRKTLVNK